MTINRNLKSQRIPSKFAAAANPELPPAVLLRALARAPAQAGWSGAALPAVHSPTLCYWAALHASVHSELVQIGMNENNAASFSTGLSLISPKDFSSSAGIRGSKSRVNTTCLLAGAIKSITKSFQMQAGVLTVEIHPVHSLTSSALNEIF